MNKKIEKIDMNKYRDRGIINLFKMRKKGSITDGVALIETVGR